MVHNESVAVGLRVASESYRYRRKRLAYYSVNIGTKCEHGCHYCRSGVLLRMHPSFSDMERSPFEDGFAIIDPMTSE